jgi:hypothetical protein
MRYRKSASALLLLFASFISYSQGVGIPSKKGGIGVGNIPTFTGIRFNFADKHVEKISGINVTIWQAKSESDQSGTVNGISLGLPLALGTENKNGVGVGILGVGATKNLTGLNLGGLGVGAGGNITGFNIGGLGIGSGGNLKGINVGGLGAGAGGDVFGINVGGLGIGAGGNLTGLNVGGLGVGGGENVSGINVAFLGVGSGKKLKGITLAGIGAGAGETINGITIAGLGVGAGKELKGLVISGLAAGSPKVKAIAIAPVVGGETVNGLIIAPFHLLVGPNKKFRHNDEETTEEGNGTMKGVSVSIFSKVNGQQNGVSIGVANYTRKIKGVQFGLINIVKENPKGLRILPIFNTRFGKKSE